MKNLKVDGTYSSSLVVQGWSQVPGIDCGGTFAPVCRLENIRMMLATAPELGSEVFVLDVQTVFLNADIKGDVFLARWPPAAK